MKFEQWLVNGDPLIRKDSQDLVEQKLYKAVLRLFLTAPAKDFSWFSKWGTLYRIAEANFQRPRLVAIVNKSMTESDYQRLLQYHNRSNNAGMAPFSDAQNDESGLTEKYVPQGLFLAGDDVRILDREWHHTWSAGGVPNMEVVGEVGTILKYEGELTNGDPIWNLVIDVYDSDDNQHLIEKKLRRSEVSKHIEQVSGTATFLVESLAMTMPEWCSRIRLPDGGWFREECKYSQANLTCESHGFYRRVLEAIDGQTMSYSINIDQLPGWSTEFMNVWNDALKTCETTEKTGRPVYLGNIPLSYATHVEPVSQKEIDQMAANLLSYLSQHIPADYFMKMLIVLIIDKGLGMRFLSIDNERVIAMREYANWCIHQKRRLFELNNRPVYIGMIKGPSEEEEDTDKPVEAKINNIKYVSDGEESLSSLTSSDYETDSECDPGEYLPLRTQCGLILFNQRCEVMSVQGMNKIGMHLPTGEHFTDEDELCTILSHDNEEHRMEYYLDMNEDYAARDVGAGMVLMHTGIAVSSDKFVQMNSSNGITWYIAFWNEICDDMEPEPSESRKFVRLLDLEDDNYLTAVRALSTFRAKQISQKIMTRDIIPKPCGEPLLNRKRGNELQTEECKRIRVHMMGTGFANPEERKQVINRLDDRLFKKRKREERSEEHEYDVPDDHGPLDGKGFKPRVLFDSGAGRCTRPKRKKDMNYKEVQVASVEREFDALQTSEGEILTGCETICAGDFAVNQAGFTFVWMSGYCVLVKLSDKQNEELRELIEALPKQETVRLDDIYGTPFMSVEAFEDIRRRGGMSPIPAYSCAVEESDARNKEDAVRDKFLTNRHRVTERFSIFHGIADGTKKLMAESVQRLMREAPDEISDDVGARLMRRWNNVSMRPDNVIRKERIWCPGTHVNKAAVKMIDVIEEPKEAITVKSSYNEAAQAAIRDIENYCELSMCMASAELMVTIDINGLAEKFEDIEIRTNRNGNFAVMKISGNHATATIRKNGTIIVQGALNRDETLKTLRKVGKFIAKIGYPAMYQGAMIICVQYVYRAGKHVKMFDTAKILNERYRDTYVVTYEPEMDGQGCGMRNTLKIQVRGRKLTFSIFRGGCFRVHTKDLSNAEMAFELARLIFILNKEDMFVDPHINIKMLKTKVYEAPAKDDPDRVKFGGEPKDPPEKWGHVIYMKDGQLRKTTPENSMSFCRDLKYDLQEIHDVATMANCFKDEFDKLSDMKEKAKAAMSLMEILDENKTYISGSVGGTMRYQMVFLDVDEINKMIGDYVESCNRAYDKWRETYPEKKQFKFVVYDDTEPEPEQEIIPVRMMGTVTEVHKEQTSSLTWFEKIQSSYLMISWFSGCCTARPHLTCNDMVWWNYQLGEQAPCTNDPRRFSKLFKLSNNCTSPWRNVKHDMEVYDHGGYGCIEYCASCEKARELIEEQGEKALWKIISKNWNQVIEDSGAKNYPTRINMVNTCEGRESEEIDRAYQHCGIQPVEYIRANKLISTKET